MGGIWREIPAEPAMEELRPEGRGDRPQMETWIALTFGERWRGVKRTRVGHAFGVPEERRECLAEGEPCSVPRPRQRPCTGEPHAGHPGACAHRSRTRQTQPPGERQLHSGWPAARPRRLRGRPTRGKVATRYTPALRAVIQKLLGQSV